MRRDAFGNEGWTALTGGDLEAFLEKVNAAQDKFSFSGSGIFVHWRSLAFYPKCALIRLTDTNWHPVPLTLWYVGQGGKLTQMDGTSKPIHEVNKQLDVQVSGDLAIDYLRFFCFFVHGEAGPFHIVETVDDLELLGELPAEQQKQLEEVLHPPMVDDKEGEGGSHFVIANVLYGDTLYRAKFKVLPTGQVEMLEDESLFGGLVTSGSIPLM